MGAWGHGARQSLWHVRGSRWLGRVLQRLRETPPLGCTPRGMFPPALLPCLGLFPNRNEETLSFAATFVAVSLKHPGEGGGCFRVAPWFQLRETLHHPGSTEDTSDTEETRTALPPLLRGPSGTSRGANLLRPGSAQASACGRWGR